MDGKAKARTFQSILEQVASANASRLMCKARTANALAKSAATKKVRVAAYRVKLHALLALKAGFPTQITVRPDPQYGTYFVLVKDCASRFGLHAPARFFDQRAA